MIALSLAIASVALIVMTDWRWLRGPVERLASNQAERQLHIDGDFSVQLGWPYARVAATRIRVVNPSWARVENLLTADAAEFNVHLPSFFRLRLDIRDVRLQRPVLALERNAVGAESWTFGDTDRGTEKIFNVGNIHVELGRLTYDDLLQGTSIQAEVATTGADDSKAGSAVGGTGAIFALHGQWHDLALEARGQMGITIGAPAGNKSLPLRLTATLGATSIEADGMITSLARLEGADMRVAIKGANLADMHRHLGLTLPATGGYKLAGRLTHQGSRWRFADFSGNFGNSDVQGTIDVDTGGVRPLLRGAITSERLHLDDLAPMIGMKPSTPGRGTRLPSGAPSSGSVRTATSSSPRQTAATTRVLPAEPFRPDRWTYAEAQVAFTATRIHRTQGLPLDNFVTFIRLQDAVVTLDPFDFGLAGGHLAGTVTLDGRQSPIRAAARLHVRKVLLNQLFPANAALPDATGHVHGEIALAGAGDAVGSMLGAAGGRMSFGVVDGHVRRRVLEQLTWKIPVDLALNTRGDEMVPIRCGIANFEVERGVVRTTTLFVDTDVVAVRGSGRVDLARETLDVTLTPQAKQRSLLRVRAPLQVAGTLAHPAVGVDVAAVVGTSIGAVVLGIVNPFLALLPLVDFGPTVASGCGNAPPPVASLPRLVSNAR